MHSFSTDGSQIVLCGVSGAVCVWSLTGKTFPPPPVRSVASGDGRRLMTSADGEVSVTEMATGAQIGSPIRPDSRIELIRLNNNGRIGAVVRQMEPTNCFTWRACSMSNIRKRFRLNLRSRRVAGPSASTPTGGMVPSWMAILARTVDLPTGVVVSLRLPVTADYGSGIMDWQGHRLITWSPGSAFIHVW